MLECSYEFLFVCIIVRKTLCFQIKDVWFFFKSHLHCVFFKLQSTQYFVPNFSWCSVLNCSDKQPLFRGINTQVSCHWKFESFKTYWHSKQFQDFDHVSRTQILSMYDFFFYLFFPIKISAGENLGFYHLCGLINELHYHKAIKGAAFIIIIFYFFCFSTKMLIKCE